MASLLEVRLHSEFYGVKRRTPQCRTPQARFLPGMTGIFSVGGEVGEKGKRRQARAPVRPRYGFSTARKKRREALVVSKPVTSAAPFLRAIGLVTRCHRSNDSATLEDA